MTNEKQWVTCPKCDRPKDKDKPCACEQEIRE